MGNIKRILPIAVTLFAVSGFALWVASWSWTAQVTATAGSQPDTITCSIPIDITSDGNTTINCDYNNDNGSVNFTFDLTESLTSTSDNCNFESGKDIVWYVGINDADYQLVSDTENPTLSMGSGANTINVRANASPYRCGVNGTVEIQGTIQ